MTSGWNTIEGIERSMIGSGGIRYHAMRAGSGAPVILLAGFPQSSYAWRRVMPALGAEFGSAPDLYEGLRPLGDHVEGGVIAGCGHFIPEEQPVQLAERMLAFFAAHGT